MPSKNDTSGTSSPELSTIGSEAGLRMPGYDGPEATEATGLLGAGAQESLGHRNLRKDSWVGAEDFDHIPSWRRPSVWWLLGPYALFTLAFGGVLVPKLDLIIDLVCKSYYSDRAASDPSFQFNPVILGGENPQCRIPEVQRNVATFTLVLNLIVGMLSAFTAPKLGGLSDRYGRKRVMVLVSLGGLTGEVITILTAKYPDVVDYHWLLLGTAFDGLAGSFTAGSVLSHSYTSDCTPPSKRSVYIGYLHACLFSGLAFGPLIAAFLVEKTGSLLSIFYIVLACHILFILFILFVIPESLSKRKQINAREKYAKERDARMQSPAWTAQTTSYGQRVSKTLHKLSHANPFAPLKVLAPSGPGTSAALRRNIIALAIIDCVIMGAAVSAGTVVILYSKFIFGWGTVESSKFISLVSMVRFFVLMAIFPVVNYLFRVRPAARRRRSQSYTGPIIEKNAGADKLDLWVLRFSLVTDVIGVTGYIFARTEALFVLSACVAAFGGLASATIQSSITKHVPAERVGQLLGAIGQLHALARVVFPVIFNGMYAATVDTFPQAFLVVLVCMFVLILGASTLVRSDVYMKDESDIASSLADDRQANNHITEDTLVDEEVLPASMR